MGNTIKSKMPYRVVLKTLIILGLLLFLKSGLIYGSEAIQLVDCAGRTVSLKSKAKRIVDLTFSEGSRTLVALEAEDLLVGISNTIHRILSRTEEMKRVYAVLPKVAPGLSSLPDVGSPKEPNIEKILSLKPDVVFIAWSRKKYADILQNQIGIPVICIGGYGSFNFDVFEVAGKVTGKTERANQLIRYTQSKIGRVTSVIQNIQKNQKKRIFYWVRPVIGTPMTNGRYEAFDAAGTVNVSFVGNKTPYGVFKVTKEQILAWNPDMIFKQSVFTVDVPGWHTLKTIGTDPVIRYTNAARDQRIYSIRGHMRGWDIATEAVEVLYVAKIAYPERFSRLNVAREGDEILKTFYRVEGMFSEMSEKTGLHRWLGEN